MWCVAQLDEEYVGKMEDVLALYEKPVNPREPVVCLDEKSVVLHAEVRPVQPAAPGREGRRDGEYRRCGTANVFCGVEPKAGQHFTRVTRTRSAAEFAQMVGVLADAHPRARTIHLVMDNLNTHCQKSLTDYYGEKIGARLWKRLTVHHTPKHGSWLNQAEIEIGLFSRQCLGKRRMPESCRLHTEARAWNRRVNRDRARHAEPNGRRHTAGDCGRHKLAEAHGARVHQHAAQEDRDRDHQHPARERPGAGLRSREVASQQGSRQEGTGGGTTIFEGGNLEIDPPRRLVQSFRALWGEEVKSAGTLRVTWEIEPVGDSCLLKVTHDQLREDANNQLYGGWPMILSGIKTLIETGEILITPESLRWLQGVKEQLPEVGGSQSR
jgi:uncharacterized protein YndB with AHSA1/START domain